MWPYCGHSQLQWTIWVIGLDWKSPHEVSTCESHLCCRSEFNNEIEDAKVTRGQTEDSDFLMWSHKLPQVVLT